MNIERLTQLAEWLEGGGKHERFTFDMSTGLRVTLDETRPGDDPVCGTACCIAGAALQFYGDENEREALLQEAIRQADGDEHDTDDDGNPQGEASWPFIEHEATRLLDLSAEQADDLFTPNAVHISGMLMPLSSFSDPQWAARTIRHLIATGEVDWESTRSHKS